jgi:hypothetical protein
MSMPRLVALAGLLSVVVGACAAPAPTLYVDVRTGLVPGPEFDAVRVVLYRGSAQRDAPTEALRVIERGARFDEAAAFRAGTRVAALEGLTPGTWTVGVRLLRPPAGTGALLVERRVTLTLEADRVLVVPLTSDCVAVECPAPGGSPAFAECLNGSCVDPFCDPLDPTTWAEHCCDPLDPRADCSAGPAFCAETNDCGATPACATARCADGLCVEEPVAGACAEGTYCAPSGACEPVEGSLPDGCVQAICELASEPCWWSFVDCDSGDCTPFVRREAGSACPGGVCSNDGACLACPGAPACDPSSDGDGDGVPDRLDVEHCDGLDNDGDGMVDEGLALAREVSFLDADHDGHGDPATEATRCVGFPGTAGLGDDCDDTRAEVSPGVAESCNGRDDDCDTLVDADDVAAADGLCDAGSRCAGGRCGPVVEGGTVVASGASSLELRAAVRVPGSDDLLIAGAYTGTLTIGSESRSGEGRDGFLARLRSDGSPVWVERIGGAGNDQLGGLAIAEDGTVVVGGALCGAATLCGDPVSPPRGGCTGFVLRLTSAGAPDCAWSSLFEAGTTAYVARVAVRPHGATHRVYVTGTAQGEPAGHGLSPGATYTPFVLAMEERGAGPPVDLWTRMLPGSSAGIQGLTASSTRVLLTGGSTDIDLGGVVISETVHAGFVASYDAETGALADHLVLRSGASTFVGPVVHDGSDLFVAGAFGGVLDVGGHVVRARAGGQQPFVARLDAETLSTGWAVGLGVGTGGFVPALAVDGELVTVSTAFESWISVGGARRDVPGAWAEALTTFARSDGASLTLRATGPLAIPGLGGTPCPAADGSLRWLVPFRFALDVEGTLIDGLGGYELALVTLRP